MAGVLKIRNANDDGWIEIGGASPALDLFKHNLKIVPGTTSTSEVTVTADRLAVADSSGNVLILSDVSEADIDITASGAGGLDTGSEASSTMYDIWIIYNGTTVAGLLSTSDSGPTMPSGYTYKRLVGEIYNNSSSAFEELARNDDWVYFMTPQNVFTNYTAQTSFVSQNLPSAVPAGCDTLLFEAGTDIAAKSLELLVAPTSATNWNVPFNNYDGVGRVTNAGASGFYQPVTGFMRHDGGTDISVRSLNSAATNADQNLTVWGYRLPR